MQDVPHLALKFRSLWFIAITSESNYCLDSKSGVLSKYCSHFDMLCDMFLMILIARFGFPERAFNEVYIEMNELVLK